MGVQAVYARLGWGVVLAAVLVFGSLRWRPVPWGGLAACVGFALAVMWLPGQASPAHWLGLAFQWPSALLVALCTAGLVRAVGPAHGANAPLLPASLALALTVGGAVLYADASGWLALGMYAAGFGPVAAPAASLLIGSVGAGLMLWGAHRSVGAALLATAALYAFTRLPTGNVFDAYLDPFLWLCALWSVLRRAARRR